MSGRELVLVTSDYPFGDHSDFLAEEIGYLAERFDTITLVPLAGRGPRQATPENVVTDVSLSGSNMRNRRLSGLIAPRALRMLVSETRDTKTLTKPRSVLKMALAVGHAENVRRWATTREPPAVGYTYWLGPAVVGLREAWPSVPIVSRVHNGDLFWERHDPPMVPLQGHAIAASTAIASVSEAGVRYLRHRHPAESDHICLKRLGTLNSVGTAAPSVDGTIRIISVSSLNPVKRPRLLAESVCRFARDHHAVAWHHFGDGPLRSDVAEVVSKSAPPSLTVTMEGQTSHDEMMKHLVSDPWDVFINVSEWEGVPVSIMEAKSAGIPLVATGAGGTSEVVDADTDQLLKVDVGSSEVAAAIAAAVATDPTAREVRRQRWMDEFSAETNYARFADWLAHMTDDRI